MRRLIQLSAAAALVFAAQQASAQAGSPLPGSNKDPSSPATPSTPPQAAPATGQAATGAADPAAAKTIEQIHSMNAKMIHVGKLGAERGSTTNVKEYGQRLATEHERLDRELAQMAQKRGIQLAPAEQYASEPGHTSAWQPVAAKTGIEFDRAYMDIIVQERAARVDELKKFRDGTPGRDAELKKWLDDAEVLMEKTRNEARDVRQAVRQEQQQQQRQGRKP